MKWYFGESFFPSSKITLLHNVKQVVMPPEHYILMIIRQDQVARDGDKLPCWAVIYVLLH